ncbi:HEAT repeat domain-containing protein [Paenibacillus glycanilyticus]|uniref:HEAT repeat domain-containing protein n=1 Tax=Paenibacillus glycanilyticus TaxID=126569 RepID=UPI00203C0769|nr:HEAT repeat domain-containing protein [Paenibacillus glycanilyticus]MCM3628230.1 HEAT repeat domain-containing protein [Paenibacillus glycanilyticus]
MSNEMNLLNDEQMIQFITNGYLVLHNDLPDELHRSVMNQIDFVLQNEGNPGNNILPRVPDIQKFFETPVTKGALTSVLGPDYYMHPHRHMHFNQPGNGKPGGGDWHKDGFWSSMRSHRPWWVMMFYYTQDITEDMGPTAIMPGSQYNETFPNQSTLLPTGKAGTIALVHFDLWHKASLNTSIIDRYMLKFQFVRLSEPKSPSWNHTKAEADFPPDASDAHLNLWNDVWSWLKGEGGKEKTPGGELAEVPALIEALSRENEVIRSQAADKLGLIGKAAAAAVPKLAELIGDSSENAALNAVYALGHIGDSGTKALLKEVAEGSRLTAQRAAYGLQASGKDAIPGLIQLLAHQDENRRALAAFMLGMLGSAASSAVPSLIVALNDASEWVRRNGVEALGMIAEPADETVPALVRTLEEAVARESAGKENVSTDSYVDNQEYITNKIAYTAALSLLRIGKHGDADLVIDGLVSGLQSQDRYARAYAFEALTAIRSARAVDVLIKQYRAARWCPDTHKSSTF